MARIVVAVFKYLEDVVPLNRRRKRILVNLSLGD